MTYQEIAAMMDEIGLPYSYYQFNNNTAVPPPFICFLYPGIDDVYADNINFQRVTQLNIELYTDNKDFAAEKRVEDVLAAYELSYYKEETYIDTEQLYETLYTMEVIINA